MIRCRDLFLSCPLYFFPYSRTRCIDSSCSSLSSCSFRLSHRLISFLLFTCASVSENTLAWVPPFPIAILKTTSYFISLVQEKPNMPSGHYYRLCSWSGSSNHLIKIILMLHWCGQSTYHRPHKYSEFPLNVLISQYIRFNNTYGFQYCSSWNNSENRLNYNIS